MVQHGRRLSVDLYFVLYRELKTKQFFSSGRSIKVRRLVFSRARVNRFLLNVSHGGFSLKKTTRAEANLISKASIRH